MEASSIPDLARSLEQAKAEGNQLFQQGRFEAAIAAYDRGADLLEDVLPSTLGDEARKLALAIYGNAAHALLKGTPPPEGAAEKACAMADKALALEPSNVKARFRRGCAHALKEQWSLAAADFGHVLKQEPGNDAARQELEKVQQFLRVAFEDLMAAAEGFKAEGAGLFAAGSYFQAYEVWKKGVDSLKEAAADCEAARKLSVAMCNNSAQALLKCADVEGAGTDLARAMAQKALALEPGNIKALFRRGCAYANAEDWQHAQADFQRVLKAEPANEAAKRELGRAEAELAANPPPPTPQAREPRSRPEPNRAAESQTDPAQVVATAQQEAERLRRKLLDLAEAHGKSMTWTQRLNRLQVQTTEWVQQQLADAEMVQDLAAVWGPLFEAMDAEEREDFLAAVEFAREVQSRYGSEIEELGRQIFGTPDAAAEASLLDDQ